MVALATNVTTGKITNGTIGKPRNEQMLYQYRLCSGFPNGAIGITIGTNGFTNGTIGRTLNDIGIPLVPLVEP